MRKTELTKKQQKEFKWLMDAKTKNEDIEMNLRRFMMEKEFKLSEREHNLRNLVRM